jgi:hypothetical protein
MPTFAARLGHNVLEAIALARAGDLSGAEPIGSPIRLEWRVNRIQFLYELAFLRIFVEWERFLEETFLRYLCGYQSAHGGCQLVAGQFYGSLGTAEAAILGGRPYALWHDPARIIQRSQRFFVGGFHENVVSSNAARLSDLVAVRHRIVHDQSDARQKFDQAAMNFVGRRYGASRPGRFLRDWDASVNPPRRWLETLGVEITSLATQIA